MIVNADDFGRSGETNRAIVAAFDQGLVSSTSAMANQPGFEEAVQLAHERRLAEHVGAHLVLTSGTPLTDPIRRVRPFCDADGSFTTWHYRQHVWQLDAAAHDALRRELRAQVERLRSAALPVTHLDSHHHAHTEWPICSEVIGLARELRVPYVRLARNCGPGIGYPSRLYKTVLNGRLHRARLRATRWFGDCSDWLHLKERGADDESLDDFELMTHPVLDADGRLVDSEHRHLELAAMLAPISGVTSARSFSGATYSRT